MRSEGTHVGRAVMDGLFLEFDIADVATTGSIKVPWKARILLGFDRQDGVYRAAIADSQGTMGFLEGKLEGTRLRMNLKSKNTIDGRPFNYRLTFDMRDHASISFSSEVQHDTGDWVLTEKKQLTKQ
jgi:hypothetical protein